MVSSWFAFLRQTPRVLGQGLVAACLATGGYAQTPEVAEPLSLLQAIQLALSHNRTLEKASLDRESQRFDLRVAEDEFVPNLDLLSGVRYNPVTASGTDTTTRFGTASAVVSQRLPTGARFGIAWDNVATDRSTQATKLYDSSLFLQLDQPLLRGAGLQANLSGLRIARLAESTSFLEFERIVINTVTNVIFSYRSLLQAQHQEEVSRSAYDRANEQLRINRALVSAGILPPVEIIQTEADIATREFNLLTAQAVREAARFALLKLLDVDTDSVFVPTEALVLPEFVLDFETCRELAYAHRADYQQAIQARRIAELAEATARNNQLWSLNLSSRYRVAGGDTAFSSAIDRVFSGLNEDWNVGLTLQVPFGDLSRRQGHLRARIREQKATVDLTEITDNIEIEVRDAFRAIELAGRRVKVAGVARELAERKLDIEKGKLQVGRTSNFAIITFQNDLVTARTNEISAQISYLNSLTALEQTLGTTLLVWGIHLQDFSAESAARAELAPAP